MLAKQNRLTKKKDFEEVFKKGKTHKHGFLLFKTMKNKQEESRFGFVVSKKVSKKATDRNMVKRRLRSAVAKALQQKRLKSSQDVVILTLPEANQKNFSVIQEVISEFFKKN